MPPISTVVASNAQYRPTTPPVVLALGGTSGIGRAMAKLFAELTGGALHLIILARNRKAAEELIATLPQNPTSTYEFVPIDATSIAEVRRVGAELAARLTKINFIVLTCMFVKLPLHSPSTPEGNDPMVTLGFLSRMRFLVDLLPLMDVAAQAGERTGVLQIGGAGYGGNFDLDDLDLRKKCAVLRLKRAMASYNDTALLELSRQHPAVHFVHNSPGVIMTDLYGAPTRAVFRVMNVGRTTEQCAHYSLYPLLASEEKFQRGLTRVDSHADPVKPNPAVTEDAIKRVWAWVEERTRAHPRRRTSISYIGVSKLVRTGQD